MWTALARIADGAVAFVRGAGYLAAVCLVAGVVACGVLFLVMAAGG